MKTWLCALLFILVGYFLAVVIGLLMNYGKVNEKNKLNRDNVIGLMDGFTLLVVYVFQTEKSLGCKPIPTAEASKQVYNDLLSTYSEPRIVGMMNQILKYSDDNKYSKSDIEQFIKDIGISYGKIIGKYCNSLEPKIHTQAPQNYNLGPSQYMARGGCGM